MFVAVEVLQSLQFTVAVRGSTVADKPLMKFPVGRQIIARNLFASGDVPQRPEVDANPVHVGIGSATVVQVGIGFRSTLDVLVIVDLNGIPSRVIDDWTVVRDENFVSAYTPVGDEALLSIGTN